MEDMTMLNEIALHTFSAAVADEDGFLSMTCAECGVSVGGDKPSDLYDVDEWAGPCAPVVERVERLAVDSGPLTYNPFAVLAS
jgi:hypothetical protein